MASNEEIVREFMGAWSRLDAEELVEFFTDEGVYHNIPVEPVSGREALRSFIAGFISDWTATEWEITNLVADGDLVMVERIDRTTAGDRRVDLPCVGVFEMRDGKIAVWRDYFDMGTYANAMYGG